jgi:hypothetical protein
MSQVLLGMCIYIFIVIEIRSERLLVVGLGAAFPLSGIRKVPLGHLLRQLIVFDSFLLFVVGRGAQLVFAFVVRARFDRGWIVVR